MNKQSNVALEVKHVSKSFKLPTEQANGIKQAFVNWTKGIKGYKEQHVLKDISFKVEKGDFFGIVGRNGSGKSTLLKVISQIYSPEKGEVKVNGTLIPFIELGVGFNPELTGRENIYLNGALLGFSRDEISSMYEEIVEFAELEEFMDQKLKNYSSGMQVRLAFSIAIKAQGDILVLDEVLAVGDEAFQRKCDQFFSQIKKDKSKTVILVTHSMDSVRRYCNKAMFIKDGKIVIQGNKDDVAEKYTEENLVSEEVKKEVEAVGYELNVDPVNKDSHITNSKKGFDFKISYKIPEKEKNPHIAFSINDEKRGGILYDSGSFEVKSGEGVLKYHMPLELFNSGEFRISATIRLGDNKLGQHPAIKFTSLEESCIFVVQNKNEKSDYALLNSEVYKIEQIK